MTVSFKVFACVYFSILGWFVLECFLTFNGYDFYSLAQFAITIMGLEGFACFLAVIKLSNRFKIIKAPPDEIRREDDVLLQGTPFLSAILFFYLTTITSDIKAKVILGLSIVLFTGTFYVLRAVAKIKSLPKYRFVSMFFLVYLGTSAIFEIFVTVFPLVFPSFLTLPSSIQVLTIAGSGVTVFLPTALVGLYFPKRYGVTISIFKKRV